MKAPRITLVAALVVAVGCPTPGANDVPETPDISGQYNMALSLLDNGCFDFGYGELMAWTLENNGVRSMSIAMGQEGSSLMGVIGPDVGCELLGTVGTEGTWNLSGPCDDEWMDRSVRISATSTPSGQGFTLEGMLLFEVDGEPDTEGGADGEIDCEVEHRIQGSGTPG